MRFLFARPRMMIIIMTIAVLVPLALQGAVEAAAHQSVDSAYRQTNLVSDIPGLAAFTDPHLVNPWGISMSSTSPFWVSDNGTGFSTLYNGQGKPFPPGAPLVVSIPSASGSGPGRASA